MAITNYTELQAALTRWVHRGDLASSIPDFITLTETRLNRLLRLQQMEKQASGSLSSAVLAFPSDCLEIRQLDVAVTGGVQRVLYLTPEQFVLQEATPGVPAFCTVIGRELRLSPTPQGQGYTLTYYGAIAALSDSNTTNWLLTQAPDLYLYGALCEAAPYLKDDARILIWEKRFGDAVADLVGADKRAGSSQLTIRTS